MKLAKRSLFAFALLLGLMLPARADLEREFTYSLHPDTPQNSYNAGLDHFSGFTRETFFNCIDRVEGQSAGTISSGEFTIEFNPDKTATISWNFTNTDHFFLGVYVAGGNRGNLYENIAVPEGSQFRGTAEVDAPRRHHGGGLAAISHIDFFCGRIDHVPDSGGTLMLFASSLLGLGLIRRGVVACGGGYTLQNRSTFSP